MSDLNAVIWFAKAAIMCSLRFSFALAIAAACSVDGCQSLALQFGRRGSEGMGLQGARGLHCKKSEILMKKMRLLHFTAHLSLYLPQFCEYPGLPLADINRLPSELHPN